MACIPSSCNAPASCRMPTCSSLLEVGSDGIPIVEVSRKRLRQNASLWLKSRRQP